MKTKLLISMLLVLGLVLSACSSSSPAAVTPASSTALPELATLAVGTYRLAGDPSTIDASQAGELAMLWKAYRELTTRDSAAAQEKSDLLAQIRSTLTADQQQAITDMALTVRDVMTLAGDLGVGLGTGAAASTSASRPNISGSGFPGGGNGAGQGRFAGGMPPDMGAGFQPEGDFPGGMDQAGAGNSGQAQTSRVNRAETLSVILLEPLITRLETLAGTAP